MSDALVGGHDTEPPTPSHEMRLDEGTASTLDAWIRSMSRPAPTTVGRLPSHSPTCAGCGKDNPAGLALEVDATEHGVSAVHRFDDRQEGAPGITHGGLVAAAFDDLFGFLLYRVGELAVTRSLTVEYLRPVLLGVSYEFTAHIRDRAGGGFFQGVIKAAGGDHLTVEHLQGSHQAGEQRRIVIHAENPHALNALADGFCFLQHRRHLTLGQRHGDTEYGALAWPGANR